MRLVSDKVRSDDSDDAVPEPVGSGSETNTARTDGEGEDFTDDDPGARTPGGGEGGDVQADEGNHSPGGVLVVETRLSGGGSDDGSDELEDDHESSTEDEQVTATNLLNHDEGEGSRQDVDESRNKRDEERVADRAELLEEDSTEVEDEVDTSKLLHHLHDYAKSGTASVGRRGADLALEAGSPGTEVGSLGHDGHLVLVVRNDLSEFVLDVLGVDGLATHTRKSRCSLVELALLDEETRGVREQHETSSKDDSPEELDGDGNAV